MPKKETIFLENAYPPRQTICPIRECRGMVEYSMKSLAYKCKKCGAEIIFMAPISE